MTGNERRAAELAELLETAQGDEWTRLFREYQLLIEQMCSNGEIA